MSKAVRMLCVSTLFVASCALAQVPVFPPYARSTEKASTPSTKTPPLYCKPCLFYGGDLDPTSLLADTDANQNSIPGGSPIISQIYSPFVVPKGQTWRVTPLFINA